jgi:16S rRNA (adenine1518-N6/adenine1519-N6)-dimethyltransferase
VTADALAADLHSLVPEGGRVAGNLPYYVSSPLLRRFLSLRGHVRDLHVMLQDEVARRVASPPGSREYGILSVLYALWADTDVPARFPRLVFSSAEGRLRGAAVLFLEGPRAEVPDPDGFERFLQKAFSRRRRTLENNLKDSYPNLKEYLRFLNVEGSRRTETLSVVELAALWRAVKGPPTGARG